MKSKISALAVIALLVAVTGTACTKKKQEDTEKQPQASAKLQGVDMDQKLIKVGVLNDESGPAAVIGKPYAVGKRIIAETVNAGGSGLLPEGWKLELVERDHGYNPQSAVQLYNEIKDEVLFIGTSFGTPNTLPLVPMLARENLSAFPASLSSKMAENEVTPPVGPSYKMEAMRALDFAVEHAGGADKVKAGIVYQQDDYGSDGIEGLKAAAAHHGVEIVCEQTVAPGQTDYTAVVSTLKETGANYVLLTTLPSATGPIVGTAAQLQYMPVWLGNTPSWIDRFFSKEVIPPVVFTNFYWVVGLPFWGEDVPGMKEFLARYEKFGKGVTPDFYIFVSYFQGLVEMEAVRRALEKGDLSRKGFMAALKTIKNWDAGGMVQPIDLSVFPYVTGTKTRVLKPVMDKGTWEVVAPYADPLALNAGSAGDAVQQQTDAAPDAPAAAE